MALHARGHDPFGYAPFGCVQGRQDRLYRAPTEWLCYPSTSGHDISCPYKGLGEKAAARLTTSRIGRRIARLTGGCRAPTSCSCAACILLYLFACQHWLCLFACWHWPKERT